VSDIDFLRRRVVLHENAIAVGGRTHVGTLKSGRSRSVALPAFVVDELAVTCTGKERDELIWPARDGGYLAPPTNKSWMAGTLQRCQDADKTFPRITAHDLLPYCSVVGDLCWRECESRATDVGPRQCGYDARRVRRPFR
jgi:hypothetical protein